MCRGGKWAPLRFCITPAPLRHFGTFIKCYHKHFLPLRSTLYICKKNFSTRAHAPLREHRLHVNSEQMWGDMRRRDAVGAADVFSWQHQELEHLSVLVLLELCFPLFFQLECWISCVVTGTVLFPHMMSWATLSTGKFIWWAPDGVWS